MAPLSAGAGRSKWSDPARMSRPDLCVATSSRRNSRSRRWRLSIASSSVCFGRTPRNNPTSPSPGWRSTIRVDRLVSRARSTPQLTAIVVVPVPPFAPKNTSVVAPGVVTVCASRRLAARRIASWNVLLGGGQVKNSFAPARIASRMVSGSAASAIMKIPAAGDAARARSIVPTAAGRSVRPSTRIRSAAPLRAAPSSATATGVVHERRRRPICVLNGSSRLTMSATRCAIVSAPPESCVKRSVRRLQRPDPRAMSLRARF